jgi:cytidylate kinase
MEAIYHQPRLAAAGERQMKTWVLLQETADRLASGMAVKAAARGFRYVTISRETGAGGTTVGKLVGERLGWEVYDSNLLDAVAEKHKESRLMLDLVDESEGNWVFDIFGNWMDRKLVTHDKYAAQIRSMIQILAKAGCAVFVGRGAQFMLPRSELLAVRIIASERYRLDRTMRMENLDHASAIHLLRDKDRGRKESIARSFRRDIEEPHHYDMVLNAEHLGHNLAADLIVAAVIARRVARQTTMVE